jgi:hypothetical protein
MEGDQRLFVIWLYLNMPLKSIGLIYRCAGRDDIRRRGHFFFLHQQVFRNRQRRLGIQPIDAIWVPSA